MFIPSGKVNDMLWKANLIRGADLRILKKECKNQHTHTISNAALKEFALIQVTNCERQKIVISLGYMDFLWGSGVE